MIFDVVIVRGRAGLSKKPILGTLGTLLATLRTSYFVYSILIPAGNFTEKKSKTKSSIFIILV